MRWGWLVAAGAALIGAGGWLRVPTPWLLWTIGAGSVVMFLLGLRFADGRRRAMIAAVLTGAFAAVGTGAQRQLAHIARDWTGYAQGVERDGARALHTALDDALARARAAAEAAVAAPPTGPDSTVPLSRPDQGRGDVGVARWRNGRLAGWAGTMRVPPESMTAPVGAAFTPFYLVLYVNAVRGADRAIATVVVHAEPPADKLAAALDEPVALETGVRGFGYAPGAAPRTGLTPFAVDSVVLFQSRPAPALREAAQVQALDAARRRGGPLLALAIIAAIAAAWGRGSSLRGRLVALWIAAAVVSVVPLNAYSNLSRLFDAGVYYAGFGGPFTANLAALMLTSALTLLGLMALQRAPGQFLRRWQAAVTVVVLAGLGPLLLRDLAQGIVVPPDGISFSLFVGWQVALFLAGMAIVVAGIAAGRDARAARRGLGAWVGPVIAAGAALAAPLLWRAQEGWPDWYTVLWAVAILALALARRTKWFLVTCAVVAGCGAVTLVWGATSKARAELAQADVRGLRSIDHETMMLVERFAQSEIVLGPSSSRAELLSRYAKSDLAAAGNPVHLASWRPDGRLAALLELSPFPERLGDVQRLADEARRSGSVRLARSAAVPWLQVVVAIPHASGAVSTVVVAPRTRLIPDAPFARFLGLGAPATREPPYALILLSIGTHGTTVRERERWVRHGYEVHGDWELNAASWPLRVHAVIELRPMEVLVPRGALLVLLDVVLVGLLWAANAAAGGALPRWLRQRRDAWLGGFRARITIALFAFALLPVLVFAAVAVRRLQNDDRRSRELVVLETLRGAISTRELGQLEEISRRFATPLLLYADGALRQASEPLHDLLAPTGRFLDPALREGTAREELLATTRSEAVGPETALMGFRSVDVADAPQRFVLAAPARADESGLDRRRDDLLIFLLFAAAMAALAALWLSGAAARQLAKPIDALRRGALALAGGGSAPLPVTGPTEFGPVFSAFRRMDADLGASRRALEEAQRRTTAVLRNVASGVIAVDERGAVVLANPRAEALAGGPLPPGQVPLGGIGARLADAARRFAEAGGDERTEEREFDVEAGARQLHARLTRLPASGGVVITVDDVTELARAQRVLAWGEMAQQVAHEIKNPLTPIRLGVQHLQRARHDGRVDFDRVLEQNAERILAEIDRLDEIARTFARYGTTLAGRPGVAPVDVAAVLRDVLALERLGGEGSVAWSLDGADQAVRAVAREDELREVLLNVLENARLAGARRVAVTLGRANGRVTVAVRDDGEGIAAEALPRVFEPHFSTRTSGSGLGLAICRRLVEGWGGTIVLTSERGRGTTVTLALASAADGAQLPAS